MPKVIDFHSHIFPNSLEQILPGGTANKVASFRKSLRSWMRPFSSKIHQTQPLYRYVPETARKGLDLLSGLAPLPGLLVESTLKDLEEAMDEAGVDSSLIIAHPSMIPNEFILESAQANPRMIPVVNIPKKILKPGNQLKKFHQQGAKALKIHPAADGEGPTSARYKVLLKTAAHLGLPVILHTGCIHSHVLYREPDFGRAEHFKPWFQAFPETQFILAHMNFHEPNIALDLAVEHPNLLVDTSWQPAEMIGEAVRRIGAERVLFGTDWPFGGNNLTVGLQRIHECIDIGMINAEQSELILGRNAERLLGLQHSDAN